MYRRLVDLADEFNLSFSDAAGAKVRQLLDEWIPLPPSRSSANNVSEDAACAVGGGDCTATCGHIFRKGEPIYRCRDCALDDTCVLCSRCFHANNQHEGHDVAFFLSSGGGGCCDCGDAEAWKVPIECPFHYGNDKPAPGTPITNVAASSGTATPAPADPESEKTQTAISILFDFVLVTTASWCEYPENAVQITQTRNLPPYADLEERFHNLAGDDQLFGVVLWNDETHSFQDVIDQVKLAFACEDEQAMRIAETVDQNGRCVIRTIRSVSDAREAAMTLRQIRLGSHVYPARDLFRESIGDVILEWLKEKMAVHPQLRSLIARVLLQEVDCSRILAIDEEHTFDEMKGDWEVAVDRKKKLAFREHFQLLLLEELMVSHRSIQPTLIELLMFYDPRMWKRFRADVREIVISCLLADAESRRDFALRFGTMYEKLSQIYMAEEREPDLNVVFYSVQLFTTPSIATLLVTEKNMLGIVMQFLQKQLGGEELVRQLAENDGTVPPSFRFNCDSDSLADRRYFHFFHDLRYLLSTEGVKQFLAQSPVLMNQFLEFISIFADMDPNVRALGAHVEFESNSWMNAFNIVYSLAPIITLFSSGLAVDETGTASGKLASLALARLSERLQADASFRLRPLPLSYEPTQCVHCIAFRVALQPVSFHNTLHWITGNSIYHFYCHLVVKNDYTPWPTAFIPESLSVPMEYLLDRKSFAAIVLMEMPLRVTVLMAQVRAGMWVRNGYAIRNQVLNYKSVSLRDDTHDNDIFLLQTAATLLSADHYLTVLMDRFELLAIFLPKPMLQHEKQHTVVLVEEFLALLIQLLTDRNRISMQSVEQLTRQEIIQVLCCGPKAYSEINRKISDTITDVAGFDEILNSVANFKFPEGVSENGQYELKEEFLQYYQPYYPHFTWTDRETAQQYINRRQSFPVASVAAVETKTHPFLAPIVNIPDGSPFAALPQLLASLMFSRLLFYSFYLASLPQEDESSLYSDRNMEESVYLLLLATAQTPSIVEAFAANCVEHNYERANKGCIHLLGLLIELLNDERWKDFHPRLLHAVYQLEISPQAALLIADFRTTLQQKQQQTASAEAERRREEARERQRKIMQQFAVAQNAFATEHAELYEDVSSDEFDSDEEQQTGVLDQSLKHRLEIPTGICILCQETVDRHSEKKYGLIGSMQLSRLSREWRVKAGESGVGDVLEWKHDDHMEEDETPLSPFAARAVRAESMVSPASTANALVEAQEVRYLSKVPAMGHAHLNLPGFFSSTCGHLIHQHCFAEYFETVKRQRRSNYSPASEKLDFTCPLCKAYSNVVFPIPMDSDFDPSAMVSKDNRVKAGTFEEWIGTDIPNLLKRLEKEFKEKDLHGEFQPDIFSFEQVLHRQVPGNEDSAIKRIEGLVDANSDVFAHVDWLGFDMFMEGFTDLPPLTIKEAEWEEFNALVGEYFVDATPARLRLEDQPAKLTSLQQFPGYRLPWRTLAYTIACQEIAERPLDPHAEPDLFPVDSAGRQVIYGLSSQSATQLQALARLQISKLANADETKELVMSTLLLKHLFSDDTSWITFPLLLNDPFELATALLTDPLLEQTNIFGSSSSEQKLHVLRYLFTLEVVRIALVLFAPGYPHTSTFADLMEMTVEEIPKDAVPAMEFRKGKAEEMRFSSDPVKHFLYTIRCWQTEGIVSEKLNRDAVSEKKDVRIELPSDVELEEAYRKDFSVFVWLLERVASEKLMQVFRLFCKPFLRRCAILVYGALGMTMPSMEEQSAYAGREEVDRLCVVLGVSVENAMADAVGHPLVSQRLQHSCLHLGRFFSNLRDRRLYFAYSYAHFAKLEGLTVEMDILSTFLDSYRPILTLAHPLPYNLEHLPQKLEDLLERYSQTVCSSCKNVPPEAALCLLCGTLVCAHSYCCSEDGRGECTRHAEWHHDVGMYLLLKKCTVLLLQNDSGCMKSAPYVDVHGETDYGLKRGKPQYLFPRRLNEYRRMYLRHQVASTIARFQESHVSMTAWENF